MNENSEDSFIVEDESDEDFAEDQLSQDSVQEKIRNRKKAKHANK